MNRSEPKKQTTLEDSLNLPGRKNELRQLVKALTLCGTGQGKAVLVSGDEGIGKTALMEAFLIHAEQQHHCQSILMVCTPDMTAPRFFGMFVSQLLTLADQTLQTLLAQINPLLEELSICWTKSDLIRLLAMIRFHDTYAQGVSRNSIEEALNQVISTRLSFFKKMQGRHTEQVRLVAGLLDDPWVLLSASLLNPLNTECQRAIALAEKTASLHFNVNTLGAYNVLPTQSPPMLEQNSVAVSYTVKSFHPTHQHETPSTQDLSRREIVVDSDPEPLLEAVSIEEMGEMLSQLLTFVSRCLRGNTSTLIWAIENWDALESADTTALSDMKELLNLVLKKTVEQRDCPLMVLLLCRSAGESYLLGGPLYAALRVKVLVPPLSPSVEQKWIAEQLKPLPCPVDHAVIETMMSQSKGNPAWMVTLQSFLKGEFSEADIKLLDLETYQTRVVATDPKELVGLLYTRLQLMFTGQESRFSKAMPLLLSLNGQAHGFTLEEASTKLFQIGDRGFTQRLLEGLIRHHFVKSDRRSYHFFRPFFLRTLQEKTQVLPLDLPQPDKVSSLKKVLPFSVKSGELTPQKTHELLSMASALEETDLIDHIESTILETLYDDETPLPVKRSLLSSVELLSPLSRIETSLFLLQTADAEIRQRACSLLQTVPRSAMTRETVTRLCHEMVPVLNDPSPGVQQEAYLFFSKTVLPHDEDFCFQILLEGLRSKPPAIKKICLSALSQFQTHEAELLPLYTELFHNAESIELQQAALKGLGHLQTEARSEILSDFLEKRPQNSLWAEVLLMLLSFDPQRALPSVQQALVQIDNPDFILPLIRQLGIQPGQLAVPLLVNFLEGQARTMAPEMRWMTLRSIGKLASSEEVLQVLENQKVYCAKDSILQQTLKSAIRQVKTRLEIMQAMSLHRMEQALNVTEAPLECSMLSVG